MPQRLATLVLAPVAALSAWAAIRLIGIDLVLKSGDTVGPVDVLAAALLGALAGSFVARLIARRSRRPRALWSFVGSTALSVSVVGPSWLADGASAVALIALHVVTAVVVICGLAATLPGPDPRRRGPASDPAR